MSLAGSVKVFIVGFAALCAGEAAAQPDRRQPLLRGLAEPGVVSRRDALVKELTGAGVFAMAEDVPLLEAMRPGGKAHPIDRVLRDGEAVTVGGSGARRIRSWIPRDTGRKSTQWSGYFWMS